jgi:hypothetical protein
MSKEGGTDRREGEARMLTWGYAWGFLAGFIACWWVKR